MDALLKLARWIDALNDRMALVATWAVGIACAVSAANATARYAFDLGSNAMLEMQWYLFAGCVMLGSAQVLRLNEHVRVDVLYNKYPTRIKVLVDLFGMSCFLLPVTAAVIVLAWPIFMRMVVSGEMSPNAGGLIRWPVMLMIPLGMTLLLLQGLSEIIKRSGWLMNRYQMDAHYERPLQ